MSDEAVVRIVLEGDKGTAPTPSALSGAEQRQQSAALLRGDALPWAPPDKPIQAPVLEGMRSDQAEYLRLESEAARRGMSVKDYKKAEVDATGGSSDDEIDRRRKEREDARNKRLGEFATNEKDFYKEYGQPPPTQAPSLTPPEPPKSAPVPVAVVEPPKPIPPPAAPPAAKAEVPVVDSLVDRLKSLDEEIAKREASGPEPGSPMQKKIDDLKQQREDATAPPPTAQLLHDPVAIAKKRVEREALLAAVDAQYAKLKPPPPPTSDPPFDPVALAKKRIEAEKKRAAVDAEYAKLKPKSATDSLLDLAQSIRGTIGGTLGTVVGAGLDIVSKVRKDKSTAATGGEDVGDAASEAGGSLAALVPVVGTTIAVVGGLTKAFTSLLGVANEMANRYGEYNPEIAQAQAVAEIRQIMGDMRRSQESSRELVDLIRAQSDLQQKWEDVKVAVMTVVIPVLTGMLEMMAKMLGIAMKSDYDEPQDPTDAILGMKQGGLGSNEMIPEL